MNLLTIKIEKNILQLAEVRQSGKKTYINKVRVFPMPENLENGSFIKNTKAFADFVVASIEKGKLAKEKAMLLLDVSSVLLKEYTHEKTKPSHLLSLASLEADAILPDNEGIFIIENEWYGNRQDQDGLQTSAIYAANEGFISGLSRDLKAKGIKLVAVFPTTIVHTDIIKKLISKGISGSEFDQKTVVALNLSNQEIRVAVFHNRELIHQRADDQIMEEFYRNVANVFHLSLEEAEEHCLKYGFDEEGIGNKKNPDAYEHMAQTAVSLITRMARSIKIILTSQNLRPHHIIISGEASAIPGLTRFINECLGIQCDGIERFYQSLSKVIDLDGELKERKKLFQRLIILAGLDFKHKKDLNFLTFGIARIRNNRRTIFVCTFIFIATILVMAILPINYYITSEDYKRNSEAIERPEYMEAQNLIIEQRNIQAQVDALEAEANRLPFGESNLSYLLLELQTKLFAGTTINTMFYNSQFETFEVLFTTKDLDSFILAKNRVNEDEKFEVSLPLTIRSDEKTFQCRISIKVLPFVGE